MSDRAGAKTWFIPDGYYPVKSNGLFPSHESICVLNPGSEDAHITITIYFEDRDCMEGFEAVCMARRTHHIRMDKLKDAAGNGVPQGIPYAAMVESDRDIIVQYSRMDTSQAEMALMSTMAFPVK